MSMKVWALEKEVQSSFLQNNNNICMFMQLSLGFSSMGL